MSFTPHCCQLRTLETFLHYRQENERKRKINRDKLTNHIPCVSPVVEMIDRVVAVGAAVVVVRCTIVVVAAAVVVVF